MELSSVLGRLMPSSAAEDARRFLHSWLDQSEWSTDDLRLWLGGENVPFRVFAEPYLWLLRGLPQGDRFEAEQAFAERVRTFLEESPDQDAEKSPRMVFNLLKLCAGLPCREQLGAALFAVYERQLQQRLLDRTYLEIPLSNCLRAALVPNQIDRNLRGERLPCGFCE